MKQFDEIVEQIKQQHKIDESKLSAIKSTLNKQTTIDVVIAVIGIIAFYNNNSLNVYGLFVLPARPVGIFLIAFAYFVSDTTYKRLKARLLLHNLGVIKKAKIDKVRKFRPVALLAGTKVWYRFQIDGAELVAHDLVKSSRAVRRSLKAGAECKILADTNTKDSIVWTQSDEDKHKIIQA